MLVYPHINPVALQLGPLAIHWYGLMYLAGFMTFIWLGRKRIITLNIRQLTNKSLDDLLFYGVLGVILGGRLGEVLFYNPSYYFSHPLKILAVWEGGMSFHGGFLGVLVAMA
ncbi:MAG: prolipoprotein diacylglyceryl transferase, partial [Gallionella sp.]|nr:prolipoprotein diacylglyceryl transferase [Gallionella sp.]